MGILILSGIIFPSYPEGNKSWLAGSELSKYYLTKPQNSIYLKLLGNTLKGMSIMNVKDWLDERFEYSSEITNRDRDMSQMFYGLYTHGRVAGACGEYATILYWLLEETHPELGKRVVLSDDHAWLEVRFGDSWLPVERGCPVWLFKLFNHHLFENPN